MIVELDRDDLGRGVLGLVVALVEVITETLQLEAVRRLDGGGLTDAEGERLGEALMDVDLALARLKRDAGLDDTVRSVRDGLDRALAGAVGSPQPAARR